MCSTPTGTRDWTKEEMVAYLDWSLALDGCIDESLRVEGKMGRQRVRTKRNGHDTKRSGLTLPSEKEVSSSTEEECIVVNP